MVRNITETIKVKSIEFFRTRKNYLWLLMVLLIALNYVVWYFWYYQIVSGYRFIYSPVVLNYGDFVNNYIIPLLGSFFSLVNLLLAILSLKKSRLASYFLIGAAIICEILILVLIRFYISNSL